MIPHMRKPISDREVYDRLHAAIIAIGAGPGETMLGDTAMKAARLKLIEIQAAVLMQMEGLLKDMPE